MKRVPTPPDYNDTLERFKRTTNTERLEPPGATLHDVVRIVAGAALLFFIAWVTA